MIVLRHALDEFYLFGGGKVLEALELLEPDDSDEESDVSRVSISLILALSIFRSISYDAALYFAHGAWLCCLTIEIRGLTVPKSDILLDLRLELRCPNL